MIAKLMQELRWPEETLHRVTRGNCYLGFHPEAHPSIINDRQFQNWALRLIAGFDDLLDRRKAYGHAVRLYCLGEQNLERTQALLDAIPYGRFSPWQILLIGGFGDAVRMVLYHLDTPQGEEVRWAYRTGPFAFAEPQYHLSSGVFAALRMRAPDDQRLRRVTAHLDLCAGCKHCAALANT